MFVNKDGRRLLRSGGPPAPAPGFRGNEAFTSARAAGVSFILWLCQLIGRSGHVTDVTCMFVQVFLSLFGSRLASLIKATPPPDDITEGSASSPTSPPLLLALSRHGNVSGLAGRQEVVPRLFLDFLRWRAKTRRRSHKATAGGRGCFGMKLDRIGSISGLGC